MAKKYLSFIVGAVALMVGVMVVTPNVTAQEDKLERKIVVFKKGFNSESQDNLLKNLGASRIGDLELINGKAVALSPRSLEALKRDPKVLRVDDDVIVEALGEVKAFGKAAPVQPVQSIPWGIDKVDADLSWGLTSGDVVKVAVIDTGIETGHPDLTDNIKGGYNAIDPTRSAEDDNGHGTHVSGIIAASNNAIGVVGMGPQIDLFAIKVLNRRGSGYLSDIIEGLDWAVQNGIQVANMSLGTTVDVQSFHDAVVRAYDAGMVLVAAAGNNSAAVNYPAAYPEVIAVSATDSSDNFASFSSRGSEVDISAPGVSVYSTYKGKIYKTLSGTSMASPHVAGAAALLLTVREKCDTNFDGMCSPDEVQNRLESTAKDLGSAGYDVYFGAGRLDVYSALTR